MDIDIDYLMKNISEQTPIASDELLYKGELSNQMKLYSSLLLLSLIIFFVSVLI